MQALAAMRGMSEGLRPEEERLVNIGELPFAFYFCLGFAGFSAGFPPAAGLGVTCNARSVHGLSPAACATTLRRNFRKPAALI